MNEALIWMPMIGQTLGHYRIESKLGEGGMGVVFKAHDTHLDRPVAIKVLPAEAVANPERKRRFVQEAKAASALNHLGSQFSPCRSASNWAVVGNSMKSHSVTL